MAQQAPNQSSQQPAAKPSGSQMRLLALVAVLVLGVIAVAYDRLMARPKSEEADKIVNALIDKRIAAPADAAPITNAEVQQALNRKPSRTTAKEYYTEEIYSWRRGLLLLSYNLYVVYTKHKDGHLELHSCSLNTPPDPEHLPGGPVQLSPNTDTSAYGPPDAGAVDDTSPPGNTPPPGTSPPPGKSPDGNATPAEPTKSPEEKAADDKAPKEKAEGGQ